MPLVERQSIQTEMLYPTILNVYVSCVLLFGKRSRKDKLKFGQKFKSNPLHSLAFHRFALSSTVQCREEFEYHPT